MNDPQPENNKKFAELVGICWHENDPPPIYTMEYGIVLVCKCGFKTQSLTELNKHIKESNPDYAADPRLVLREMERIGKLMGFLIELNLGACGFIYSYILDETGKVRDAAIKFMK